MSKGKCPKCGSQLSSKPGATHVTCSGCGSRFRVRSPATSAPTGENAGAPPEQPAGPPPALWHVTIEGRSSGPHSLEQLGEMVESGRLRSGSLVWHEGMGDWKTAFDVPEIRRLFVLHSPSVTSDAQAGRAGATQPRARRRRSSGGRGFAIAATVGLAAFAVVGAVFLLPRLRAQRTDSAKTPSVDRTRATRDVMPPRVTPPGRVSRVDPRLATAPKQVPDTDSKKPVAREQGDLKAQLGQLQIACENGKLRLQHVMMLLGDSDREMDMSGSITPERYVWYAKESSREGTTLGWVAAMRDATSVHEWSVPGADVVVQCVVRFDKVTYLRHWSISKERQGEQEQEDDPSREAIEKLQVAPPVEITAEDAAGNPYLAALLRYRGVVDRWKECAPHERSGHERQMDALFKGVRGKTFDLLLGLPDVSIRFCTFETGGCYNLTSRTESQSHSAFVLRSKKHRWGLGKAEEPVLFFDACVRCRNVDILFCGYQNESIGKLERQLRHLERSFIIIRVRGRYTAPFLERGIALQMRPTSELTFCGMLCLKDAVLLGPPVVIEPKTKAELLKELLGE